MPAQQTLFSSTVALAASGVLTSAWLDRAGSGNVPSFVVSVLADADGGFLVYEAEDMNGSDAVVVGGGSVLANIATVTTGVFGRRFLQLVYTNSSTAQTSLALTLLGTLTPHVSRSADARVFDLILRELRSQSMLLQALREPTPSTINLPFGHI